MENSFLLFAFCLVAGMSARSFIEEMRDQSPIAGLELEGIAELLFKGARDGWRSMLKRRHERTLATHNEAEGGLAAARRALPDDVSVPPPMRAQAAAAPIRALDDPTLRSLLERLSAQLLEPAPVAGDGVLSA